MICPSTTHLLLTAAMFLTLLCDPASTSDIGRHGERIILQSDVETIFITTPMRDIQSLLYTLGNNTQHIQKKILTQVIPNEIGSNKGKWNFQKEVVGILNENRNKIQVLLGKLDELAELPSDTGKTERAFELLGSVLSTITGVPSARDHRKVLEQILAVREQQEGMLGLMKQQNRQDAQIVKRFHSYETKFQRTETYINTINEHVNTNHNEIQQIVAVLSLITKTDAALLTISKAIDMATAILIASDSDRLSRFSISKPDLQALIAKLYNARTDSSPLFTGEHIESYYSLKLAHSWVSSKPFQINTVLQIPIFNTHSKHELDTLSPMNQLHADLPLVIVNYADNSFRYFSNSDYAHCEETNNFRLCQKRAIKIRPRQGCILMEKNCDAWADEVIHDLTNSRLLVILKNPMNATLSCDENPDTTVLIPMSVVMTLNIHCSLQNDRFTVSKLSYRRMLERTNEVKDIADISFEAESAILTHNPIRSSILQLETNKEGIVRLESANNYLNESLINLANAGEKRWNAISGGWTAWEQLIFWALLATTLLILLIVGVFTAKNSWQMRVVVKGRSIGGAEKGDEDERTQQHVRDLHSRVVSLENDFQLSRLELSQIQTSTPRDKTSDSIFK